MSRLPTLTAPDPPEWQRIRLARWLHEWAIERAFDEPQVPDGGVPNAPASDSPGVPACAPDAWLEGEDVGGAGPVPDDAPPAPAQIRLLSPEAEGARERPVYVAVLSACPGDGFLTAPYGRFSEPAVPGELLTGRSDAAVRVLCLWLAESMTAVRLRQSWRVDDLDAEELREALAVYHATDEGGELPPALVERTGPPVVHLSDPRRVYCREEAARMQVIREGHGLNLIGGSGPSAGAAYELGGSTLAMAAEPRAPYRTGRRYRVVGRALFLVATPRGEGDGLDVRIEDEQGAPSLLLDGAVLSLPSVSAAPALVNGRAVVPSDFVAEGSVLIDVQGGRLALDPVDSP